MVEQQPSKLKTGVRFPSPAPGFAGAKAQGIGHDRLRTEGKGKNGQSEV